MALRRLIRLPALPSRSRRTESSRIRGDQTRGPDLARPNYGYEKRQRELAKKRKKDEKNAKKASDLEAAAVASGEAAPADPPPAVADGLPGPIASEQAATS